MWDGTHTLSPGKSMGIFTNPSPRPHEDDTVDTNANSGAKEATATVTMRSTVHVVAWTMTGQRAETLLSNGSISDGIRWYIPTIRSQKDLLLALSSLMIYSCSSCTFSLKFKLTALLVLKKHFSSWITCLPILFELFSYFTLPLRVFFFLPFQTPTFSVYLNSNIILSFFF